MTTHILDISHAISDHFVTWQPVSPVNSCEAPQESILYSLVLGRTELVMFGGLQNVFPVSRARTLWFLLAWPSFHCALFWA